MTSYPIHNQSIWYEHEFDAVCIVDQTRLPHEFRIIPLESLDDACHAISSMQVRGAPLIGVTAAYGVYLAMRENPADLRVAILRLQATRPTAVNLSWALRRVHDELAPLDEMDREGRALEIAQFLAAEDIAVCSAIGEAGAQVLEKIYKRKTPGTPLNVLTHCNAGSLATVDWGTALAVIYKTAKKGIPVHVWVDETRPRNQGAALTCWELSRGEIPHTLIVDNAGGHLMQQGLVDVCVVGSDRTTANGDVCNKIGTYLKALAAWDNQIPFYAAVPLSSIDFDMRDGGDMPIEERDADEVTHVRGLDDNGDLVQVRVAPSGVNVSNYGFDVTPARLITGIITERGVVEASGEGLSSLLD